LQAVLPRHPNAFSRMVTRSRGRPRPAGNRTARERASKVTRLLGEALTWLTLMHASAMIATRLHARHIASAAWVVLGPAPPQVMQDCSCYAVHCAPRLHQDQQAAVSVQSVGAQPSPADQAAEQPSKEARRGARGAPVQEHHGHAEPVDHQQAQAQPGRVRACARNSSPAPQGACLHTSAWA